MAQTGRLTRVAATVPSLASTDEELAQLANDGIQGSRLIWTASFFSHFRTEWSERQAFREALRAAEFTGIGSTEELTGDGCWHHWSHTIREADPDALRVADEAASAIAAAHGVRYDGWQIFRDVETGKLRPASTEDAARLRAEDKHSFDMARQARERRAGGYC